MPEWVSSFLEVSNTGFAIFVAVFLLVKFRETLSSLTTAISEFSKQVDKMYKVIKKDIEATEEQTKLLQKQQVKLENIEDKVDRIPKRDELDRIAR